MLFSVTIRIRKISLLYVKEVYYMFGNPRSKYSVIFRLLLMYINIYNNCSKCTSIGNNWY